MSADWLGRALEESRRRGFLGPGPVEPQISHARGFAEVWEASHDGPPGSFLDLGSGGGLPGLVLADRWSRPAVLLDSVAKRTDFLRECLAWTDAPADVTVVTGRAETLARDARWDAAFDLVVARSFGIPAVTAECSARFAGVGGWIVVSEPPEEPSVERWPEAPLGELGLRPGLRVRVSAGYQVLEKIAPTPSAYPRAVGRPAKRPLF